MRLQRLRFELRMELAANKMRMAGNFDYLYIRSVGRGPADLQPAAGEYRFIFAIEFVAVAMALADLKLAVSAVSERLRLQFAGPRAQPHGAAQLINSTQLAQLVDDAM